MSGTDLTSTERDECDHGAHEFGCPACEQDARGLIGFALGDEWLTKHDTHIAEALIERLTSAGFHDAAEFLRGVA